MSHSRILVLSLAATMAWPLANATTQLVDFNTRNTGTTLAAQLQGNESLLVNTLVTSSTGALSNTVIFTVGTGVTDLGQLREKIRAYVADPNNKYDTVLGSVGFDANGDTTQHTISYYQYDATSKDWKFLKQRDFTADPVK